MKKKNKNIAEEAKRDREWASLRNRKDILGDLLARTLSKNPDLSKIDLALFFHCISFAFSEATIYKNENKIDSNTKALLKDKSPAGVLRRIEEEVELWKRISDKNNPIDKKIESLKKIRDMSWGYLISEKKTLQKIISVFPNVKNTEDYALVIQCVSTILMDIEIREIEIEMIEQGFSNDKQ